MTTRLEQLDNLRDFFNGSFAFICDKGTTTVNKNETRKYYATILEDVVQFFNENNPEEFDLRDQKRCARRVEELMEEEEEENNLSACCGVDVTDTGLCSNCKEHS